MITKEAIEQLQDSSQEPQVIEMEGFNYLITPQSMNAKAHTPVKPDCLIIGSLTGLVEYLKNADPAAELWKEGDRYVIHIANYNNVTLQSGLHPMHMIRRTFISAQVAGNKFPFERFFTTDQFIIALMSNFVDNDKSRELLEFVSSIRADSSREEVDRGVSQAVTVKKGITTLGDAIVPNPVALQPYVTFAEIPQPIRQYVFRIRQGKAEDPIMCGLFPIESNMWKTSVTDDIRDYFKDHMQDGAFEATIIS